MQRSLVAIFVASADALLVSHAAANVPRVSTRATCVTMEFGQGFGHYYSGWEDLCKEYPEADRTAYPALFVLPDNCYEVKVMKPLGIAFIETGGGGVEVEYLVEGSNSEKSGVIKPGDVLLATTACMGRDGKFEVRSSAVEPGTLLHLPPSC